MGFTTWREELAWAAGFFDGEGWVGSHPHKNPIHRGRAPAVAINQVGRFVLDRFRAAIGVGRVYGPYPGRGKNRQPQHRYSVAGHPAAQAIAAMLWTWLSPIKREQFRRVLTSEGPSRAHRRVTRPCVHGSPNTKRCRECQRAYQRRFYAKPGNLDKKHLQSRDYMRRRRAGLKET